MKNTTLLLSMLLIACDSGPTITLRNGSTGSTGEPWTDLSGCACDPNAAESCKPGLECVPVDGGHACLAKCSGENSKGGGFITACPTTCFYPFSGELGTGPAYCPACLGCAPVDPLSLVCQ